MTTTAELLDLTVSALKGRTVVRDNVFAPRDWPTWTGSYPLILVQAPEEDKTSLGRNAPQFNVVSTFRITARVQGLATQRDGAAVQLEAQLNDLKQQIEQALINDYQITKLTQQFPSIRSQISVSDDGEFQLGELVIHISMEFYQGPEDFYPTESYPLNEIAIAIQEPDGTNQPALDIKF